MTNPKIQPVPEDDDHDWPRTIAEAVDRLLLTLSTEEKEEIAAMPEGDLIDMHFGLGTWIRGKFGLWGENHPLLKECQKVQLKGREDVTEDFIMIHADDASWVILKALWGRLRH